MAMTEYAIDRIDPHTAVLHASAEIDEKHAASLRNTLLHLDRDGVNRIVIDMTGVEHTDGTGLSVIYRAWRRAGNHDGGLALAAPRPEIRKRLAEIRFPAMVNGDVETALHRNSVEPAAKGA